MNPDSLSAIWGKFCLLLGSKCDSNQLVNQVLHSHVFLPLYKNSISSGFCFS